MPIKVDLKKFILTLRDGAGEKVFKGRFLTIFDLGKMSRLDRWEILCLKAELCRRSIKECETDLTIADDKGEYEVLLLPVLRRSTDRDGRGKA